MFSRLCVAFFQTKKITLHLSQFILTAFFCLVIVLISPLLKCVDVSFAATETLVCDPPCGINAVCQNSSGDPECICLTGYTGEQNCTGT